jgi:hypothetical protein
MLITKVYLYDSSQENNGYRGEDLSKYLLQGDQCGEDITQEMDTAEITLVGLSMQKEFDPETKFIIDLIEKTEFGEQLVENIHYVVATDIVSQPVLSDNNYFDHHISLIEPSVVAQKRLVDNISTTYKLKDVSLEQVPAFPIEQTFVNIGNSAFTPSINFGRINKEEGQSGAIIYTSTFSTGKYFELEGSLLLENANGEVFDVRYNDIENFRVGDEFKATFIIPKLAIMFGIDGTKNFSKLGYASINCKIEEMPLNQEDVVERTISANFISNSNLGEDEWTALNGWQNRIQGEWLLEEAKKVDNFGITVDGLECYYKKYTETSAVSPTYRIENVSLSADKRYKVTISLYQFPDNIPNVANRDYKKFTGSSPSYYVKDEATTILAGADIYMYENPSKKSFTVSQTSGIGEIFTYSIETETIVYSSAIPYSALALLQKAIINSAIYEKKDGFYIADVNNSNLPFYIDPNFEDDLRSTVIIENFYNQKNLWEIMIEVGHYIHSIPELVFGEDDKFMITFNQLGRTDEKPNNSNKVSIFNSRNVEEYISATSSYITNMVQLGGLIEEWVFPKTTNEQLLVSNDTAEIIVSKPIIELLSIQVKNNITGQTANLTPFIYEENVYKTLGLDYDRNPNRGIAMYYSLGDNVITGGQFQLPQANQNAFTDYTFKKVIWCAFNNYQQAVANPNVSYWESIKIQDYSFFVQYRTKDSVRQNHIRPDLRKYLLNSKHDHFPQHNQFNNQTDVVVDSLKFGNNIYGKLIKTGNSSYEIYEWNDNYSNVKHKGELYRINGELYYVAKALHIRYSSYILSKITYSKDYNELSAVVGIPSEPRFYEISEQSLIWRELALNDILLLTDDETQLQYKSNYVFNFDHLSGLMIGEGTDFAKYALTVYKGDKDSDKYSQTIGQPNFYKEVLNPINAYSSENTLTYEWDMIDNYSAGDKVISTEKENYSSLRAVGYTDIYGKSALMDFYILGDIGNLTTEQIKALPESPIKTKIDEIEDTRPFVGNLNILGTNVKEYDTNYNGRGIGLLKDCREAMSINFNLQLATNSDTFVLSPYIYLPKKSNVRVVLLAEEVNKLSSGYINNSAVITPIDKNGNTMNPYFEFDIQKFYQENSWDSSKNVVTHFGIDFNTLFENVADEHFTDTDGFQRVKSIVLLCDVSLNTGVDNEVATTIPYKTQFVFARNIPEFWSKSKATSPIYFGAPNKNVVFTNKQ